jgi:tripartite-type tricarboxylate transporter receptor subunit TctC
MTMTKRLLLGASVALAATFGSTVAGAQSYPAKTITVIIPFAGGSASDVVSRIMFDRMSKNMKQPIIVENRPGAGGNSGTGAAAKAAPDGYTLVGGGSGPVAANLALYKVLGYDPEKDFEMISPFAGFTIVVVASKNIPIHSLKELVEYAKANPGKLNYGTPGLGSSSHLTGEMLKLAAGIQMTHVPYAGLAPAITDLLAGHTDVMTANLDSVLTHVQAGKLKGLAVTSEIRAPELPELPAIAETYPEVVSTSWFAVVAPPKTPPEIASKLSDAFAEILREPEIQKKWREMTLTPVGGTPEEVGAFLKAETARWHNVIVSGGIKRQ